MLYVDDWQGLILLDMFNVSIIFVLNYQNFQKKNALKIELISRQAVEQFHMPNNWKEQQHQPPRRHSRMGEDEQNRNGERNKFQCDKELHHDSILFPGCRLLSWNTILCCGVCFALACISAAAATVCIRTQIRMLVWLFTTKGVKDPVVWSFVKNSDDPLKRHSNSHCYQLRWS